MTETRTIRAPRGTERSCKSCAWWRPGGVVQEDLAIAHAIACERECKTVKVLQAGGNKFLLAHNFFFVAQVRRCFCGHPN